MFARRRRKILSFLTTENAISKGKSKKNDAKSQNFRLRRHLTSYIKISGRSKTRGEFKRRGGEFKRELGLIRVFTISGSKSMVCLKKWVWLTSLRSTFFLVFYSEKMSRHYFFYQPKNPWNYNIFPGDWATQIANQIKTAGVVQGNIAHPPPESSLSITGFICERSLTYYRPTLSG